MPETYTDQEEENKFLLRNDIELVTMDLYDPFRNAVKAKLKKATIVALFFLLICEYSFYNLDMNLFF